MGQLSRKIVTAFTLADDERWLPPQFVVGELAVRYVAPLDYDQYSVDGVCVDETTIRPISNPTPKLITMLKKKSLEWQRQDQNLAKSRARKDNQFREKRINKEYGVHMVREELSEAFGRFCDEMANEDRRLSRERQAEVAKLVKSFKKAR
jgi:hypothetical protein